MKNKQQTASLVIVITLAVLLPVLLKAANKAMRYWVGAEGRLAAITIDTNQNWGPLDKTWVTAMNGDETKETAELIAQNRTLINQEKSKFKPAGEGAKLLNNLGNTRMAVSGEGSWVSAIAAKNGDTIQVVVVNFDPKNAHSEIVPVNFINLKNRKFILKTVDLEGQTSQKEVTTSEAMVQQPVPMPPNSAVLLELINLE